MIGLVCTQLRFSIKCTLGSGYSTVFSSLVPRPFEEEEKGPGTHCLRMLRYPKNLSGSDTIVYFLVYLPFDLYSSRGENGRLRRIDFWARFWDSCCHVDWWWDLYLEQRWLAFSTRAIAKVRRCTENFMVVFTENLTHAQCVPGPFSSSSSKGLGMRLGVQWNMSLNMSALRSACKNYLGTCHTMYMPVRIHAYLPDHTNTSRHNMMINLQLKDSDLAKRSGKH